MGYTTVLLQSCAAWCKTVATPGVSIFLLSIRKRDLPQVHLLQTFLLSEVSQMQDCQ